MNRKQRTNAKENGEATNRIRLRNRSYRGPAAPSTSSKVQAELDVSIIHFYNLFY